MVNAVHRPDVVNASLMSRPTCVREAANTLGWAAISLLLNALGLQEVLFEFRGMLSQWNRHGPKYCRRLWGERSSPESFGRQLKVENYLTFHVTVWPELEAN